jgi:DNA-binding CsgD family transcriptional regulator
LPRHLSGVPRAGEAGLVLLDLDGSILMADVAGERGLARLQTDRRTTRVPPEVAAVARRAVDAMYAGEVAMSACAHVRIDGGSLELRASILRRNGRACTAVVIEPACARDVEIPPASAYELTGREHAVARLVAHGLATQAIGERLHISPWTVQDHLKSIFEKVGVRTRGELVARLFLGRETGDAPSPGGA